MLTADELDRLEAAARSIGAEDGKPFRVGVGSPELGIFECSPQTILALVEMARCAEAAEADAKAFRQMVDSGLAVLPYPIYAKPKHSVIAKQYDHARYLRGEGEDVLTEEIEVYGDDPVAATRRAVTRAAALAAAKKEQGNG